MSEGLGYTPEEVLQTEGANKGNFKDKDLAEKMAIAEDKVRDPNKAKEALRVAGTILEGMWMSGRTGFELGKRSREERVDRASQEAKIKEIELRVEAAAAEKGINDRAAIEEAKTQAIRSIYDEREALTRERIEEQREQLNK